MSKIATTKTKLEAIRGLFRYRNPADTYERAARKPLLPAIVFTPQRGGLQY